MEIHPATAARWDDLRAVLNPGGSPRHCWCMAWRLSSGEFNHAPREQRLRELVGSQPAPGVLAYLDGEPVGWCNVGPRAAMQRLVRSRSIEPLDDQPVWSVVCFVVRTGFRGRGVGEELLHGAVEHALGHAAPGVEGYPVDPRGNRVSTSLAYVGTVGMFARAGFRRLRETGATSAGLTRWLMRRDL